MECSESASWNVPLAAVMLFGGFHLGGGETARGVALALRAIPVGLKGGISLRARDAFSSPTGDSVSGVNQSSTSVCHSVCFT